MKYTDLTKKIIPVFFLQFLEKPEFGFLRNIEFPDNFGLSFGKILEFPKKFLEFQKKMLSFEENSQNFL